ncbi:MAG: preprotein translocase subunit YajC [bacterium]
MFEGIAWAMGPSQPGAGGQGGAGGMLTSFLPLIIIFVIFYFLLIRPQQKRAKQHREMLAAIKKGDKIITSGGIYGVVEAVSENTITLKIAENVKVKIGKGYIATVRAAADED